MNFRVNQISYRKIEFDGEIIFQKEVIHSSFTLYKTKGNQYLIEIVHELFTEDYWHWDRLFDVKIFQSADALIHSIESAWCGAGSMLDILEESFKNDAELHEAYKKFHAIRDKISRFNNNLSEIIG